MHYNDLILQTDSSKLDSGATRAKLLRKSLKNGQKKAQLQAIKKKIFITELFKILEFFKIAVKEKRRNSYLSLTIL